MYAVYSLIAQALMHERSSLRLIPALPDRNRQSRAHRLKLCVIYRVSKQNDSIIQGGCRCLSVGLRFGVAKGAIP